jgi:hypothetical protein
MDTGNVNKNEIGDEARNDYLWDGSGEPDLEIQRLEGLLGKFRHDRLAPALPEVVADRSWKYFPWRVRLFPALATAAAVVAASVGALLWYGNKPAPVLLRGWDVSQVTGTPHVGPQALGQLLETDHASRATLRAEDVGQIEVEPNTRLRMLTMGAGSRSVALDRGTIRTFIWASPGQFTVDTPSAMTVDLGCAYTLKVDDAGAGLVRTSMGWVGFKLSGREAFIPAGAACATKPKVGPGTPYFEDATANFRGALARFDFEDRSPQERARDLEIVIDESRARDALSLWHLLTRVDEGQRDLVYQRLKKFTPPPAGVTKEGILHLDRAMLDLWWNALGFDDIAVWRHWERSWSGANAPGAEK